MSGHRRVKNIGYDDDDDYDDDEYDGYEGDGNSYEPAQAEDDGMTDDDRRQIQESTVKVRSILGESSSVTDKAIQDSLWHYWFDVDKTVVYLKNEHRPKKEEKSEKPVSKFDQAAVAAAAKAPVSAANGRLIPPSPSSHRHSSLERHNASSACFKGVPWTMPPTCNATFTAVDPRPQLYLRGGSGKPSKLAALAAARKAKEAGKKENSDPNAAASESHPSNALSLLDRLGGKDGAFTASALRDSTTPARKPIKRLPVRQPEPQPAVDEVRTIQPPRTEQSPPRPTKLPRLDCGPTTFASTLCRLDIPPSTSPPRTDWTERMTWALTGHTQYPIANFSDLSPDARVFQAQTKGTKSTSKDTAKITKGVKDIQVGSKPTEPTAQARIKSKNLNVVEEYEKSAGKKELNFVVVGHIDHGKSTLMGRLLFEHKMIDQRTLDKYKREAAKLGKESFALAWVMDARDDEREHGVTIDYAEKTFTTDDTAFTVLDAPGHRDFVSNMIAGTSMADFALLVVDAGANSFAAGLKGQTREHAQVVRCMKLSKMVVAVNKMDSVSWSQDAFDSVKTQTIKFLRDTLFDPADITFVPVSGLTGDNVLRRTPSDAAKWYTGPTLTQALDNISPHREQYLGKPSDELRLRIAGFTGLSEWAEFLGPAGANEVFTAFGRLDAGNVQVGDRVVALPSGEKALVKGITKHGDSVPWAVAGQIVGLQLGECDEERFNKGDLICGVGEGKKSAATAAAAPVGALLTVKVLAFDAIFPMPVDVHRGRMRVQGQVRELVAVLNGKTGEVLKEAPKVVKAGEVARITIELDELAALDFGTRVVLRYGGETIAAGAVERVVQSD